MFKDEVFTKLMDMNFDYETAASILNGKAISSEQAKMFVCKSKWAHENVNSLRNEMLDLRHDILRRDSEIALLKQALLAAESNTCITDDQVDAIFGDSPFTARVALDKSSYEVIQRENPDWRELITNDEPKHHGYFDSYDEAEAIQRRLHVRWVLSGGA